MCKESISKHTYGRYTHINNNTCVKQGIRECTWMMPRIPESTPEGQLILACNEHSQFAKVKMKWCFYK